MSVGARWRKIWVCIEGSQLAMQASTVFVIESGLMNAKAVSTEELYLYL